MRQRGAPKWMVLDIAVWAVPFGILGGRIYHVITSPDDYFGAGGRPMKIFPIWEGGLGIWGGGGPARGGVLRWRGPADEDLRDRGGRPRHLGRGGPRRRRGVDRVPPGGPAADV